LRFYGDGYAVGFQISGAAAILYLVKLSTGATIIGQITAKKHFSFSHRDRLFTMTHNLFTYPNILLKAT
jgi:hypothetical protein